MKKTSQFKWVLNTECNRWWGKRKYLMSLKKWCAEYTICEVVMCTCVVNIYDFHYLINVGQYIERLLKWWISVNNILCISQLVCYKQLQSSNSPNLSKRLLILQPFSHSPDFTTNLLINKIVTYHLVVFCSFVEIF